MTCILIVYGYYYIHGLAVFIDILVYNLHRRVEQRQPSILKFTVTKVVRITIVVQNTNC